MGLLPTRVLGLTTLNNQSMPDNRIWLFTEPHGLPQWNQSTPYGSLYMLDLQEKETDPPRYAIGQRLLDAGITGYSIGTNPGDAFGGWKSATMADFSANFPAIRLAICIASGSVSDIVYSVKSYIDVAKNYSCAAKINNKFVIFTYAPQDSSISVADWQSVRNQLISSGYPTFFFQDVNVNWNNGIPAATDITKWFPVFDGCYIWTDANYRNTTDWSNWNWFISLMNTNGNRPFAGGMLSGYNRESLNGGYMEDSQGGYLGTSHLRAMLQGHLDSRLQWWHISTANDVSEESELLPSSWWNCSRADITRLYAYKSGAMPSKPVTTPHLYAVSPQHLHLGESLYAEALVVNWGTKPVSAQLELYDGDRSLVKTSAMIVINGDSVGAATFDGYVMNALPSRRFFRIKALLYDTAGSMVKSVWGAPICAYAVNQSASLRNCSYYAVPEQKVLPGNVSVSMQGNPALSGATMTISPPDGVTVRFAEALQNTKLILNGTQSQFIQYLATPYSVSVPTASYTVVGGEVVNPDRIGFYMGRIIDDQERVGYSDPVWADQGGVTAVENKVQHRLADCHIPEQGNARKRYTLQGRCIDSWRAGIGHKNLHTRNHGD